MTRGYTNSDLTLVRRCEELKIIIVAGLTNIGRVALMGKGFSAKVLFIGIFEEGNNHFHNTCLWLEATSKVKILLTQIDS